MIVLEKYKLILKSIGLNPRAGHENIVVRFLQWIKTIPFYLMMLFFFNFNVLDDIYRALTAMPLILVVSTLIPILWHLVTFREKLYSLMDDLQDIVNESTKNELNLSNDLVI